MPKTVAELMKTHVETVRPETSLAELDRKFLELHVGGRRAQVRARVVRVQEPSWMEIGGVGVAFQDPGDDLGELIRQVAEKVGSAD